MKRKYLAGAAFAAVLVTVGLMQKRSTVAAAGVQAPRFEVDPLWPKPLPNHWVIGATIGVAVDGKDNVWIIHREGSLEAKEKYATWKPRASECCVPAPAVLQFNQAGDLIGRGVVPDKDTSGRPRITALTSTIKATCGSGAMAADSSLPPLLPMRAKWQRQVRCMTACS